MSVRFSIPDFKPHPLLRNGHAQTLAGAYLPSGRFVERAVKLRVPLPDGDTVVLHDDRPAGWRPGDRVALLLHGLAGCHQSGYMLRIARKLRGCGVRTFRMDLRGCGAGEGLASRPYHAGRSEDARAAIELLQSLCLGSPVTVVGFSLSGNIVLKLVGESPQSVPINVEKAAAICPSLDLGLCARSLESRMQRLYERHFVWLLCKQIESNRRLRPDVPALNVERRLRTLLEFDDAYTGPVCGFGTAENYYTTNRRAGTWRIFGCRRSSSPPRMTHSFRLRPSSRSSRPRQWSCIAPSTEVISATWEKGASTQTRVGWTGESSIGSKLTSPR